MQFRATQRSPWYDEFGTTRRRPNAGATGLEGDPFLGRDCLQ